MYYSIGKMYYEITETSYLQQERFILESRNLSFENTQVHIKDIIYYRCTIVQVLYMGKNDYEIAETSHLQQERFTLESRNLSQKTCIQSSTGPYRGEKKSVHVSQYILEKKTSGKHHRNHLFNRPPKNEESVLGLGQVSLCQSIYFVKEKF